MSKILLLQRPWVCWNCAAKLSQRRFRFNLAIPRPAKRSPYRRRVKRELWNKFTLAQYWDTEAPTASQIQHASQFFEDNAPKFLWSAPKFRLVDYGSAPEVAFFGRSNVGKSSLLNALMGIDLAHTSARPGRTRTMNAFSIGTEESNDKEGRKLIVMDMPGYGHASQAEWGTEIMKYLTKRKELKMAFVLIDSEHGIKKTDASLLYTLREHGIPHQIILSKVDKIVFVPERGLPKDTVLRKQQAEVEFLMLNIRDQLEWDVGSKSSLLGEIVACSSEKGFEGTLLGIDAVQFSVLRAVGLELDANAVVEGHDTVTADDDVEGKADNDVDEGPSIDPKTGRPYGMSEEKWQELRLRYTRHRM